MFISGMIKCKIDTLMYYNFPNLTLYLNQHWVILAYSEQTDNVTDSLFNLFMPSRLVYLNSLDWSISNTKGPGYFLLLSCFIEIGLLTANSVYTDQTRFAASDLGLQCLPMPLYGKLGINGFNM